MVVHVPAPPGERCNSRPSSFAPFSAQDREVRESDKAVASNPDGAAGRIGIGVKFRISSGGLTPVRDESAWSRLAPVPSAESFTRKPWSEPAYIAATWSDTSKLIHPGA